MTARSFDQDIAIVGVGHSDFGALYRTRDRFRDAFGLGAIALREAIDDAGIDKSEIDALICSRVDYARMANVAGLHNVHFIHDLEGSGRMSGIALQEAIGLIRAGLATTVACVYGNNGRSVNMKYGGEGAGEGGGSTAGYDAMYGMTSPGAAVATMYQRYRALYNVPEDGLAPLAINNRRNASKNPVAVFRDELTLDEYLSSRFIAEPLRLLDYCLINDGGVAFLVTTMDRARNLRKPPVKVAATAGMSELTNYYPSEDFFYSVCANVSDRLYAQCGIAQKDMDLLQIYDNFLPTILFSLEGFGHADRGTAWEWIRGGRIALEGEQPLNTAGGHTSESYMQGWAHHVEAVRQIRGECGERQVAGCEVVQYVCASPIVTAHVLTAA
ncbi:MAG: thiolase family protein [Rhizobiaceae bacterium]|nr:thiolase family protein [Rhizobiaceae bacterium]